MINLTKQLYPKGRAFKIPKGGVIETLLIALTLSEERFRIDLLGILNSVLPDNTSFVEAEATLWEKRLGLTVNPAGFSLADRILLIKRKYNHPGTIIPRQNYIYMQNQLRAAGFDVYVHEVTSDIALYSYQHGTDTEHGDDTEMGSFTLDVVANSLSINEVFDIGEGYKYIVVGGENLDDFVTITVSRVIELRRLILKIKPVNVIVVLRINFNAQLVFMDDSEIDLMDGSKLDGVE